MNIPFRLHTLRGEITGLTKREYPSNGSLAIVASLRFDDGEFEQDAISVNLDHDINGYASRNLREGEFFGEVNNRKAYIDALVAAGVIEMTGQKAQSGFVTYPVCRLTDKGKALIS